MNERKKITIDLLKSTFSNFIVYAIIFTLFAALLYIQVNYYLYRNADADLSKAKVEWNAKKEKDDKETLLNNNLLSSNSSLLGISNLRIIAIERAENGDVSANSLINSSYLEYFADLNFNEENLNQVYEVSVNDKYFYRAINAKYTSKYTGETTYVQLLININSEKEMMKIFSNTLVIGFSIIIILILLLTYILTRKAMDPIIKNYEKQVEFVQNASHELRTPLTIIQAKQEMLLQSPNSKIIDKSEEIAMTLNETRRITKLLKELMDLARADSLKETINKSKQDLNKLIHDVAIPYREMSEMQKKSFKLDLNAVKECEVDPNKIKQLMVILMDNALKYTEEGDSITISTRNKDDKFFIEVKDTGIGISDEGIKHAFERFYREDKARTREKGGSGLGLSIAQTIVKQHGGSIKIEHNNPKGTIIIVRF